MNKLELKEFIKEIVRKNLNERCGGGHLAGGEKGERMFKHIKQGYKGEKSAENAERIAAATVNKNLNEINWKKLAAGAALGATLAGGGYLAGKHHNEKHPTSHSEKSPAKPPVHVSPDFDKNPNWQESKIKEAGLTSEDWKKWIKSPGAKQQISNKSSPRNKMLAKQFKKRLEEAGYKIVSSHSYTDAEEDKARTIQTEPKVNETAYKVVAPRSATDAKEDKARTIQTEPKVNETAYKIQGPSLKTFDQSLQFPDALNDPRNA